MKYEVKDETTLHSRLLTSGAITHDAECIDYMLQLIDYCKNAYPGGFNRVMHVFKTIIDCQVERLDNDRA